MSVLQIRLLGGFTLAWDEIPLPLISSKTARSILAFLVTYHTQPHTRDLLTGTFWPDLPDKTARRRLSRALWEIQSPFRSALDEATLPVALLQVEGDAVQLTPSLPLWTDVKQFTEHYAQGTQGGADALAHWSTCLELYQGDFMAGYYDDWLLTERERLWEMFLITLDRLIAGHKARGEYEQALILARRLAEQDPWREDPHCEIIRLYHLLGRDSESLNHFESYCQTLAKDLDAEPSPKISSLAAEIAARTEEAYTLLPSAARPSRGSLFERPDQLPLVGRQAELTELLRQTENMAKGHGGITLVYGSGGIGKTRLLQELAHNAEWRGFHVVWGHCYELSTPPAYQPLIEALRTSLPVLHRSELPPLWRTELSRLLPELSSGRQALPPLKPEEEQRRLLEALSRAFLALASNTPCLVLLEDIHWIDLASLDTLRYLLPRLADVPLRIVLTARPEELGEGVSDLLNTIENTRLLQRLNLGPLSQTETETLLQRVLEIQQAIPRFSARLYRETEGHPFFLIETLRTLMDEGILYRDPVGAWKTPWDQSTEDYAELPLPAGIAQSIGSRLKRLPANLSKLLGLAAVIGQVPFDLWLQASGQNEDELLAAGDELCTRGLLVVTDAATAVDYAFAHNLIRRVSYDQLAPPRRRAYHRQVALALAERSPDQLAALAFHWTQAQEWQQAMEYHRQAGDREREVYAHAAAASHYTRALEALSHIAGPDGLERRVELLLARETALFNHADRSAQAEDLAALEALAKQLDDRQRQANVALRRAIYAENTGDFPGTIAAAQSAIGLAQAIGDTSLEAEGHLLWGRALWRQGEYEAALVQLQHSLVLARSAQLPQIEARSLRDQGVVHWYQGNYTAAQVYFEQAQTISRKIGDKNCEALSTNNMGLIYAAQGHYSQARDCFKHTLHIDRETGNRYSESLLLGNLGAVSMDMGDYTSALAYHQEALQLCRAIGNRTTEAVNLGGLSATCHCLGEYQSALAYAQEVLRLAEELGDRMAQGYAWNDVGHALSGLGKRLEAIAAYEKALDIRRSLGQHQLALDSLEGLAHVQIAQGEMAQAQACVEEILGFLESSPLEGKEVSPRIYGTCYQILKVLQDGRAQGILNTAYDLLQERASRISDEEMRRCFLENIAAHRQIVAAYNEPILRAYRQITVQLPRVDAPLGRPLHDDKYTQVTWTVAAPGDAAASDKATRRRQRLLRLLREAQSQGAAPTHSHLAEALQVSRRTIERDVQVLRQQYDDEFPPTRGKA